MRYFQKLQKSKEFKFKRDYMIHFDSECTLQATNILPAVYCLLSKKMVVIYKRLFYPTYDENHAETKSIK